MPKVICSGCGRVKATSPCSTCGPAQQRRRDAQRGTTTQRGLGWAHQQQRTRLIQAYEQQHGPITHCPRCARAISKDNPITAQHTRARAHGGTQADALWCKACNSSEGATVRKRR